MEWAGGGRQKIGKIRKSGWKRRSNVGGGNEKKKLGDE